MEKSQTETMKSLFFLSSKQREGFMNSEAAGARQVTYMDGFQNLGGLGTVAHWQVSKSICIHSPTKPNKLAVDFSLR